MKPPPVLPSRYLKLVSCSSLTASSPWGISAGTIPIHASSGSSGATNVKSMPSLLLKEDLERLIVISADSVVASSSGALPPEEEMVILPTPTQRLVPVGRLPSDLGRDQPPLYQSFQPSWSRSSKLQEGAPPLFAL